MLGGPFVVCQVVGVYGDAGLAEEGAGVVEARFGSVSGEGCFYQVVAVPADAVDAQAGEFTFGEAPVEVGGGGPGLFFAGELVA